MYFMSRLATAAVFIAALSAAMGLIGCRPNEQNVHLPAPHANDGKMIIEAAKSVRWSSQIDSETRRALQTGRRRLGIKVIAYEPPTSGAAILVVYILTSTKTERHEINRFGIHPNVAFRTSNRVEPQRFLISLADHPDLLEESEIRLEIDFDSSQGHLKGGMAEISIEFVDI